MYVCVYVYTSISSYPRNNGVMPFVMRCVCMTRPLVSLRLKKIVDAEVC